MVKIFCDRCGEEIDQNKGIGYISLNLRDNYDGSLMEENEFEDSQFCLRCISHIREYVKRKEEKALSADDLNKEDIQTDIVKADKIEENSSKKRVDVGKIIALSDAGWDNKKIAEEMKMTAQQVASAKYNHKKKMKSGNGVKMHPVYLSSERPKI